MSESKKIEALERRTKSLEKQLHDATHEVDEDNVIMITDGGSVIHVRERHS
ncbi:hypothetical protein [Vibrio sp. K4]|uniref:hypothetical protein n=1 Tax=Vibrio sp. K4 TaxID=3391579 RepID=UPI003DA6D329|nr:hypothetical protein [Vibrio parahaemolyticus]HCZ9711937.1 hypothetical protein [Vibrio parahaemolyticus]